MKRGGLTMGDGGGLTTFNSFEDETRVRLYCISTTRLNFQFLWGWNDILQIIVENREQLPFNSFEDETGLLSDGGYGTTGNSFNSFEDETTSSNPRRRPAYMLSIPLRMKLQRHLGKSFLRPKSFNSFEDETSILRYWYLTTLKLSIPLRMKQ